MRRDGGKAQDFAKRHGVPRWYADADALIRDKEVDAVYVATPPGTHELYAMKVLVAGKPCYVEKPMSRNASEARRILEGFRAKGVPLFVAYYRRALPRFLKVAELLNGGVLGRVKEVEYVFANALMKQPAADGKTPWRLEREHSGGGLFLDLGSHALDLLDFWLGPLTLSTSVAGNTAGAFQVEDWVKLEFSARLGSGKASWRFTEEKGVDEFALHGNKATVRLSCFGNEPIRLTHFDGREEMFDIPYPPHVHQPLIQTIVNELNGSGVCPSKGDNGLRAQKLMDQALHDFYGGREDGFWKREMT